MRPESILSCVAKNNPTAFHRTSAHPNELAAAIVFGGRRRRALAAGCAAALLLSAAPALGMPLSLMWGRQFGTSSSDLVRGIAADNSGIIYVAGTTLASLGGPNLGSYDGALFRIDPANSATIWSRNIGTSAQHEIHGVSVGLAGEAMIAGISYGSFASSQAGNGDAILASYNSSGTLNWSRQIGSTGFDIAIGCATGPTGNVHTGGYTTGSLFTGNYGSYDVISIARDSSGNSVYGAQHGTSARDHAHIPAVDAAGNTYLTGIGEGALGGGTYQGGWDSFLLKLDTAGNIVWRRPIATTAADSGEQVAVDASGNIYVVGLTAGLLGAGSFGGQDVLVRKYDSDGNVLWTSQFGSSGNDRATGIAIDQFGNAHVAGIAAGPILGLTHLGGTDAFVVVYDAGGQIIAKRIIGGTGNETDVARIALDAFGNILLATSTDGGVYSGNAGGTDWVIAKLEHIPEPAAAVALLALLAARRRRSAGGRVVA